MAVQQRNKASMEDVARRANVSRATVSFALNGRKDQTLRADTVERVFKAAHELGYQPNRIAQVLAGAATFQIQLCARGLHPGFHSRAIAEYQKQLDTTPYDLRIVDTFRWSESNWERVGADWPVDGIIVFESPMSQRVLDIYLSRGIPVVTAGVCYNMGADYVGVQLDEAVSTAVAHLVQTGRRRIAHFTRIYESTAVGFPGDHRHSAYVAALAQAKLPPEVIVTKMSEDGDRQSAYTALAQYITSHGCPDAIVCMNDEMVIAASAALFDMGINVPQQVALVGCDDIEETRYHRPVLSSIAFPFADVARKSWQFLMKRMEYPLMAQQTCLMNAPFMARESTNRAIQEEEN